MEDLQEKFADLNSRVQTLEETVRKLTDMEQPKIVLNEKSICYKCKANFYRKNMIYEWVDGNPCDSTYDYVCRSCSNTYK